MGTDIQVVKFKAKEPKSAEALIEILRGYMDLAFDEEILGLEITAQVRGENHQRHISFTTSPK